MNSILGKIESDIFAFTKFFKKNMAFGLMLASFFAVFAFGVESLAQVQIPGTDESQKLEAAGTMLRLVDTGLFIWGSRLFAGLFIFAAGFYLKEQRFGAALISIIAAIFLGTAGVWVKNIFAIGGNAGGIFDNAQVVHERYVDHA